jgi:hypothetical protein
MRKHPLLAAFDHSRHSSEKHSQVRPIWLRHASAVYGNIVFPLNCLHTASSYLTYTLSPQTMNRIIYSIQSLTFTWIRENSHLHLNFGE